MMRFQLSLLVGVLILSSSAFAAKQTFELDSNAPNGIGFSVFSAGNKPLHDGTVNRVSKDGKEKVQGSIIYDSEAKTLSGELVVPIRNLFIDAFLGQGLMNCHIVEALGVEYNMNTHTKDLCSLTGSLSAPIAYPNITFKFENSSITGPAANKEYLASGTWTLHGVSKAGQIKFKVEDETESDGHLYITGSATILMTDFNMHVIPISTVLDIGGVAPTVNIKLNKLPLLPVE